MKGIPQKALRQWKGPYRITAITRRGFTIKHEGDGSIVQGLRRNHLQHYTAKIVDQGTAAELEAIQPRMVELAPNQLVELGDHASDEQGSFKFQLGRFNGIVDGDPDYIKVIYLGTTTSKAPYRFREVWIDHADNDKVVLQAPAKSSKPSKKGIKKSMLRQWSGEEPVEHVLPVPIGLTASGALTAATIAALGKWRPHVLQ